MFMVQGAKGRGSLEGGVVVVPRLGRRGLALAEALRVLRGEAEVRHARARQGRVHDAVELLRHDEPRRGELGELAPHRVLAEAKRRRDVVERRGVPLPQQEEDARPRAAPRHAAPHVAPQARSPG